MPSQAERSAGHLEPRLTAVNHRAEPIASGTTANCAEPICPRLRGTLSWDAEPAAYRRLGVARDEALSRRCALRSRRGRGQVGMTATGRHRTCTTGPSAQRCRRGRVKGPAAAAVNSHGSRVTDKDSGLATRRTTNILMRDFSTGVAYQEVVSSFRRKSLKTSCRVVSPNGRLSTQTADS